ncbi:hypothetical protein evm_002979 [Chilo suppressalis]|nr:hypothetical protein evm_002979 [Chilo suppressalis]
MSKLSFRARALDALKPMPIYLAEELPDLPDYSAINRAVPQMPSGMEKEEESEHHLQRAISGTGLIIPTPEVCEVSDLEFYERCYPPDYKMPKQHIHMQPLWEEQEAPEYDIDSEDERWLKQQRHPELNEWKFEQMMDKLERSSGQTVVTLHEAKLLLERHDDLVTAVYDYWLNKRLTTQHALILSVKTESRPGQSSNNPYLAFRRRTEKMQTRKNRKNDESSYEKMLKLRRDLARALSLLELVARRENAKRELVKLTAHLAERRHAARDYHHHLLPEPPRTSYAGSTTAVTFRAYAAHRPPTPPDPTRQREKRPYKRRKYRHAVTVAPLPEIGGVASSSEEEMADDGPFAFRRKPGCYYEMPTSTLCGDPLEDEKASGGALYQHELDERHRFTLTSIREPYPRCIGFARRRLCRGGRVALDRIRTPLQDLWPTLPYRTRTELQDDIESKAHRTPKEITHDYHTGGKYPWRHSFRQHLAKNPHLWTEPDIKPVKMDIDIKTEPEFINSEDLKHLKYNEDCRISTDTKILDTECKSTEFKCNNSDECRHSMDRKFASDDKFTDCSVKSVCGVSDSDKARTIDCNVRDNLRRVMRKRSWSGCSDASYESDDSLQPVEREFEKFINEVNEKWLHFRPKTPPPAPPSPEYDPTEQTPLTPNEPITVELRTELPTSGLETFTTSEFTLADLYGDINPEEKDIKDNKDISLDGSGDDLNNFTGLTEDQVESILSEADLKALADVDLTKEVVVKGEDFLDSFLSQSQGVEGRACPGKRKAGARNSAFNSYNCGSSVVKVLQPRPVKLYVDLAKPIPVNVEEIKTPEITAKITPTPRPASVKAAAAPKIKVVETPVPTSKIIVEEVNEVPQAAPPTVHVKLERKRSEAKPPEEVKETAALPQQKASIKHSPYKRHVITSAAVTHPRSDDAPHPQILTVSVSDSLKVRLQNHLVSSPTSVLVQNGPFPPVAVLPIHQSGHKGTVTVSTTPVSAPSARPAGRGALQLHAPLVVAPHHHHLPHNKLKENITRKNSTRTRQQTGLEPAPFAIRANALTNYATAVLTDRVEILLAILKLQGSAISSHYSAYAHPLTQAQRAQLLGRSAGVPGVVSLSPLADNKPVLSSPPHAADWIQGRGQLGKDVYVYRRKVTSF